MNRFITGRLGIFSFIAVLFAAGCAVEQGTDTSEEHEESQDSSMVGTGSSVPRLDVPDSPMFRHNAKLTEHCANCGPLPDPWQMGPLPDPWSSSSSGGSSTSSSSSSSGGGSTTSSSGGKP